MINKEAHWKAFREAESKRTHRFKKPEPACAECVILQRRFRIKNSARLNANVLREPGDLKSRALVQDGGEARRGLLLGPVGRTHTKALLSHAQGGTYKNTPIFPLVNVVVNNTRCINI